MPAPNPHGKRFTCKCDDCRVFQRAYKKEWQERQGSEYRRKRSAYHWERIAADPARKERLYDQMRTWRTSNADKVKVRRSRAGKKRWERAQSDPALRERLRKASRECAKRKFQNLSPEEHKVRREKINATQRKRYQENAAWRAKRAAYMRDYHRRDGATGIINQEDLQWLRQGTESLRKAKKYLRESQRA